MTRHRPRLVVVHMIDNAPSVEGILVEKPDGYYKLEKAKLIVDANNHQTLDGTTWVPSPRVMMLQVLS
jgi:prophage tail gpP-like protein